MCLAECCQPVTLNPFQPKSDQIIKKSKRKQGKKMVPSTWPGTMTSLGSHYVLLHLRTKSEDNFLMKGFNNWKKDREKFSSHADSGTHKKALLKIQTDVEPRRNTFLPTQTTSS